MKNKILLFFISAVSLTACSTAYKSGQTPDDLYYAKGKVTGDETVRNEQHNDSPEDRSIRMAVYDPRWRTLDDRYDYDCRYSPYAYGYNYGYYYNPYYYPYPVYTGGVKFINPKNTTIRSTNLNTYNNTISTYNPIKAGGNVRITSVRGYNDENTRTIRNVNIDSRTYDPSNNKNNSSGSSSNNNSNNNHSSSGSNSSSGTSVPRPSRGN